jgi:uncharacterized protein with von Willebrand factor type A (vWA) domain
MEGRLGRWAGQVLAGVIATGARRRMRLGYVEFNEGADRFTAAGRFLHRSYAGLLQLGAQRRAEGRTGYEAPLRVALEELQRAAERERHVLLLTDGMPVVGDPRVARETEAARRHGVRIHTLFLGLGECPPVLDEISLRTGGVRFRARPVRGGGLRVEARGGHA